MYIPEQWCAIRSIFIPEGKFGNVWRHFWLSQLQGGVWRGMPQTASGMKPEVLLNVLHCTGQTLTRKNYLVLSVNRVEVEKPTDRQTVWIWILGRLLTHWIDLISCSLSPCHTGFFAIFLNTSGTFPLPEVPAIFAWTAFFQFSASLSLSHFPQGHNSNVPHLPF